MQQEPTREQIIKNLEKAAKAVPLVECPICKGEYAHASMEQHLLTCPLIDAGSVTSNRDKTYVSINGQGNVCKRCWKMFGISDWVHHRKSGKCKERWEKSGSSNAYSEVDSLSSFRVSLRHSSDSSFPLLQIVMLLTTLAFTLTDYKGLHLKEVIASL